METAEAEFVFKGHQWDVLNLIYKTGLLFSSSSDGIFVPSKIPQLNFFFVGTVRVWNLKVKNN